MPFFSEIFVGRRRRGLLVSLVEKASPERIRRILEITEGERNHELLLFVKNLQELSASPFPYIVPVIPHPLLAELVRGEHFVLTDLLKSIPGSSSQAGESQEPQAEMALGALVSHKAAPQAMEKKKRKKAKKVGQIKAADAGLDGFVD